MFSVALGTMLYPHLGQRAKIPASSKLPISSSFSGRGIPTLFSSSNYLMRSSPLRHVLSRPSLPSIKRKRIRQDNCLQEKRKHKPHIVFRFPQFTGRCNFHEFYIWSFFVWVMEEFRSQNSTEETSVLAQPLPQLPASSSSINISPCVLRSGPGKPPTLREAQCSGPGHGQSRQTNPPAAGASPPLLTGVPGLRPGAAAEPPRLSLRSERGRDRLRMGLAAKKCESV